MCGDFGCPWDNGGWLVSGLRSARSLRPFRNSFSNRELGRPARQAPAIMFSTADADPTVTGPREPPSARAAETKEMVIELADLGRWVEDVRRIFRLDVGESAPPGYKWWAPAPRLGQGLRGSRPTRGRMRAQDEPWSGRWPHAWCWQHRALRGAECLPPLHCPLQVHLRVHLPAVWPGPAWLGGAHEWHGGARPHHYDAAAQQKGGARGRACPRRPFTWCACKDGRHSSDPLPPILPSPPVNADTTRLCCVPAAFERASSALGLRALNHRAADALQVRRPPP
jgi:hypothetical protein